MNGVALRNTASGETAASRLNVEVNIRHSTSRELAQLLDEQLGVCEQDTRNASPSDTTFRPSPASETGKSFSRESKPVSKSPLEKGTISDGLNQVPAKSAWSKDDDGKGKKGTTTSISLRAIQEAEAKKQQILKASEREKKETTRANVTPEFKEDLQPFMGSWGLPTSQTAARGNIIIPTKDVPAQSAMQATHAVPVWTTTSKTPVIKKAMKEIQEEEEKRKRLAAKDISVATSKRFAETTSKASADSPFLLFIYLGKRTDNVITRFSYSVEQQPLDDRGAEWQTDFSLSTESGPIPYDFLLGCIKSIGW